MTQEEMFPTVTSSPQVIPANPSQSQASKEARKMTATSGRTSLELLHPKDPLGAFSKTFMVTLAWDSTRSCTTWKAKATPQGRLLFQLVASVRDTKGTDSGLLHTPTAKANQLAPSMNSGYWPTPDANCGDRGTLKEFQKIRPSGQSAQYTINQAVRDNPQMWPTPTANEDAAGTPNGKMQGMLGNHPEVRGTTPEEWKRGSLNPNWVEWLMGYPQGWTDLTGGTQSQKTSQE